MHRSKATSFIIHAAGWLLFFIFPLLFLSNGQEGNRTGVLLASPYYWLFCLTYIILFYFNLWYLVPYFFFKKQYHIYSLGVVLLLGCVYVLQPFEKLLTNNPYGQTQIHRPEPPPQNRAPVPQWPAGAMNNEEGPPPFNPGGPHHRHMQQPAGWPPDHPPGRHPNNFDIVSLVLFFIITALSLAIRTVQQWQSTEQKVIAAEAGKAQAELSFLKARINPHFLFNTLNNIYTLSVTNSPHTSESIMKLSNIMRYVTDDVVEHFVPLQHDIDCISNYIDLQCLRLGKKARVDFKVTGDAGRLKIAPLILMSFIENAFKYGISKQEFSLIRIDIHISSDDIQFCCENRIFRGQPVTIERAGIGIANTRQRLMQLYPEKHVLAIDEQGDKFEVKLILQN